MNRESRPATRRVWWQRKIVALALLGFASGLPLYLTSRTLQAWMRTESVDLTTIGLFSLVSLPYSLKFLIAPVMDRYVPPFLGRRRGWLVITQLALLVAIAAMALQDPRRSLQLLAVNTLLIAFFSASQDIVADAYRTDVLAEREMGAGAAIFVLGYRVALVVTASLAFVLADHMPWPLVYLGLSALMLIGVAASIWAPEPATRDAPPQTFVAAVVLPFREFFQRAGVGGGLLVLLFIVLYKFPDALTQAMATPFFLDLSFTQTDIGAIYGGVGIAATIVGSLGGGMLVARMGINRAVWIAGFLQALSNLAYYTLAKAGTNYPMMVTAIVTENVCFGLAGSVSVALLMSLCNVRFSATQYALLSSLMAVSRDLLAAPSGAVAEATGWSTYFLLSVAAAIPGLLLLPVLAPWNRETPPFAAAHPGETVGGGG